MEFVGSAGEVGGFGDVVGLEREQRVVGLRTEFWAAK